MPPIDILLLILVLLLLAFIFYEKYIIGIMHGNTLCKISLKRKNKVDYLIFIGLVGVFIYHTDLSNSHALTNYLLFILALEAVYISCIRTPKLLFKNTGFFYAGVFIFYHRIKDINLSEDGVLIIGLEQRQLLIYVTHLDDLEKVYPLFMKNK